MHQEWTRTSAEESGEKQEINCSSFRLLLGFSEASRSCHKELNLYPHVLNLSWSYDFLHLIAHNGSDVCCFQGCFSKSLTYFCSSSCPSASPWKQDQAGLLENRWSIAKSSSCPSWSPRCMRESVQNQQSHRADSELTLDARGLLSPALSNKSSRPTQLEAERNIRWCVPLGFTILHAALLWQWITDSETGTRGSALPSQKPKTCSIDFGDWRVGRN